MTTDYEEGYLDEWVDALTPDRKSRTADDSWLFGWFGDNHHALDFYDDGDVVAIGQDEEDPDKDGFCEVTIEDREWIENFAVHGWFESNPSFMSK